MTPFTVPNLPTDNLYKFKALSGVIFILFVLTSLVYVMFNIESDLDELKKTSSMIELEKNHLASDLLNLDKLLKSVDKSISEYEDPDTNKNDLVDKRLRYTDMLTKIRKDPAYRDYLEFTYKYSNEILPVRTDHEESKRLNTQITITKRKIELKDGQLFINANALSRKINQLQGYSIVGLILCFFASIWAHIGFSSWKKQVQNPMDRKIAIEVELLEIELKEKQPEIQTEEVYTDESDASDEV